ncbi:MAG: hypothetical protein HXY34_11900 [Candidatus Thorarchaeota archaeon]|nr:hypothetical protein [Candidatus Thorarchaeota archaeon]
MSALENRTLDKLFDMVLNVLWQDRLELWTAVRKKMDTEGVESAKTAFRGALSRFMGGPLKDQIDVRWGMRLCMHCNDENIEKNGIAYVTPSGDGLEFNQCLNCRIGMVYKVVAANAHLDTYTIALGQPKQFNGFSFYWDAIVPDSLRYKLPLYEVIRDGQWIGTVSIDKSLKPSLLRFEDMKHGVDRGDRSVWTEALPADLLAGVQSFIEVARNHLDVALAIS